VFLLSAPFQNPFVIFHEIIVETLVIILALMSAVRLVLADWRHVSEDWKRARKKRDRA
jgi:hypothetical protein